MYLLQIEVINMAQAMGKIKNTNKRERSSVYLYISLKLPLSDGPHKCKSVVIRIPTGVTAIK